MNPFDPDSRDPWFDHWLIAGDRETAAAVDTAVAELLAYEQREKLRRRRNTNTMPTLERVVDNIVSNLIRRASYPVKGDDQIAVSRRKQPPPARYKSPTHIDEFPAILDRLEALGYVETVASGDFYEQRCTTVRAGEKLRAHISARYAEPNFGRIPDQEIVVLKGDKPELSSTQLVDYTDDEKTNAMRAKVRRINETVESYEIEYSGMAPVDLSDRHMRRIFSRESFELGGRLFGGFWMHNKGCRRHLKVEGESLVQVDFVSMMAALAYADIGQELPGDAYCLGSYDREAVKRMMLSMLGARRKLTAWPTGVQNLFPEGTPFALVRDRIERTHPALAEQWYKDRSVRFMNTESEILLGVLTVLMRQGVPALPIHDAVLVPESAAGVTEEVMLGSFRHRTGRAGRVSVGVP